MKRYQLAVHSTLKTLLAILHSHDGQDPQQRTGQISGGKRHQ